MCLTSLVSPFSLLLWGLVAVQWLPELWQQQVWLSEIFLPSSLFTFNAYTLTINNTALWAGKAEEDCCRVLVSFSPFFQRPGAEGEILELN